MFCIYLSKTLSFYSFRVCLNENLENIATSVLSNVKAIKNCKELQHVTHIKESINNGFIKANKQSNSIKLLEDTLNTSSALQIHPGKSNKSNPLQKRYFKKWQIYITKKKGDKEQSSETVVQKEKLHQFLKTLNRYQRQKSQVNEPPIRFKCKKDTFNKSNSNKLNDTYFNISTAKENHYNNYKHRFVAQQKIIDVQKRKLIEQEEIIDELKLGKLEKDINKSIIEAEEQIQETLKNTSFKVKQNISPILISTVQNELEQFRLNSNKAPKIVQQMEKRAFERQQKHKLILERKCIIEQTRKQAIQKEIERKKLQDEEQKIQNLEELKARRIKEMNIRKKIQMQKLQFLENRQKVDSFYRKKLLKFGFESFLLLIQIKSNNYFESHEHYKNSLKRKVFNNWINFINKINDEKYAKARNFYNLKLKKEIMRLWMKVSSILNIL